MKRIFPIFLLLATIKSFSQEDPATLAIEITVNQTTELGKVKAIFNWITGNISYKTKVKKAIIGPASFKNYYEADDDGPLKPMNERVSITVLKKREAVCDGYARLFTTLCDYAGIRSEVIVGYARGDNYSKQRFSVNHYWNAVQIEGKWYLLDATWASGYLSRYGDEFIRNYDPGYFLTPPEIFIRDHYPDDARWTLLDDARVPEEFRHSPFRQKSFTKYGFRSFSPSNGIIEASVGDTIRLKLEMAQVRNISPDLLVDTAIFTHSPNWVFLRPDPGHHPNTCMYTFPVLSGDIKWLYLVYNDDLVLRYKVNVRTGDRK
jgi:hypothetical protein